MDLQYIKKLVRLVEQSGVDEIELEEGGTTIRIVKHTNAVSVASLTPTQQFGQVPASAQQRSITETPAIEEKSPPAKPEVKYHEIKSPIVGTFYRAPAPDADSYVQVGQVIQSGTVLCIIEAMKLMNEIESDVAGRIIKIAIENGQPVEYNQLLFLIEPI
jgi:acetyl-CoA carboxylase biotin carboxyl carrier protein